jgi:hypothetical protein
MNWWSRYKAKRARLAESIAYEWKDRELGIYFQEQLDDPIWKHVTPRVAELIQEGFAEIYRKARLEEFSDTNSIPAEVIDLIGEVANKRAEPNNINPAYTILVTHQYVDADPNLRLGYKTRWVAFMVKRKTFAPPPESYVGFIKDRYFTKKSSYS